MSDLISREDAIKAVAIAALDDRDELEAIKALPSSEAEPTVVRCKTMIHYGDFREWAKRIREDNPNVIVIPFDAEVVSAEAVQGWIPCSERLPKPWESVITTIRWVGDEYEDDYDIAVGFKKISGGWDLTLADGTGVIKGFLVTAWMPLPTPYKGGDDK